MKIRYVHASAPAEERVCDTEKTLAGSIGFVRQFGAVPTQEEWDRQELERFEAGTQKGVVLSYQVIEEGGNQSE